MLGKTWKLLHPHGKCFGNPTSLLYFIQCHLNKEKTLSNEPASFMLDVLCFFVSLFFFVSQPSYCSLLKSFPSCLTLKQHTFWCNDNIQLSCAFLRFFYALSTLSYALSTLSYPFIRFYMLLYAFICFIWTKCALSTL